MDVISFLNKLLGDPNAKELRKLWPRAHEVRKLSESEKIRSLTLEDLPKKTAELKKWIAEGSSTDELLEEAFSTVIQACRLIQGKKLSLGKQEFAWDMVPFDVQILGGIALHDGSITEMKTGEGKTLVCTMPVYLNALTGKGVHVVTVNDYLAERDALWMGMLYEALGLTVGTILHDLHQDERKQAYAADVTYGTNNEFGFDYLRDNMAPSIKRQVQRGLHYAIVDEVDSILIDEARTPLIISQPGNESTDKYVQYAHLVGDLQENAHYNKDEKQKTAVLTEEGIAKMESLLGIDNIYTDKGFAEVHHIEQALRAHAIYERDVDYVVKDGEVIIVDEFTGRLMPGRRYSHGLHQAIEAKESVTVQRESKTLATITFQNYFRLYEKLAGMTGTAKTEEEEFESIYRLRVIVAPTNKDVVRTDKSDAIYKTLKGKFKAVAKIAQEKNQKGQPVLIGTTSIEKSEAMSALLTELHVPHQVLNAKQHRREAEIVAQAGQKGSVTIATNMAGRGTDIKLGRGVQDLGGLCVLGTERHEARRIDNQLRGRSGRQGDPGESQFFVSMDDELMRLFGGDRLKSIMERLKIPEDQPLENAMVSRSIESAQKKVEGHNFDIRRHVVQYDDVMNKHREIIYKRRQKILERMVEGEEEGKEGKEGQEEKESLGVWPASTQAQPLHQDVLSALKAEVESIAANHASDPDPDRWDVQEISESLGSLHPSFAKNFSIDRLQEFKEPEELREALSREVIDFYEEKCAKEDPETVRRCELFVVLQAIDTHWMDHIDDMAHLREQVAFAGFAQRDPLIEYKDQGFRRFRQLLALIDSTVTHTLLSIDFALFQPRRVIEEQMLKTNEDEIEQELTETGVKAAGAQPLSEDPLSVQTLQAAPSPSAPPASGKVGRNDPCPCGSGKKYKKCHGR